ncbi:pyridoxal phosphate-dependent transferase [Polychytrium aggregatum]|uniref:pyridoxal phosphate-dependent transferase n=1 Tax=Polychytrium aggregatum TaxID=110093 RepID=UPI0022FDBBC1|nr:pyridoxal phosphate-dependent transferase [Polychytrium aggregatum]KAI9208308.1 pyridoxal phosphate-dependent transferase [Polychytrium aggregatum]
MSNASHKLCMIPGPVECDGDVLASMATQATSHVAPNFIECFGETIELLRQAFFAPTGQPFVVAGSGTLTWDMTAANLVEPGDHVLVIVSGIFGDWFGECIEVYGGKVTFLKAPFGSRVSDDELRAALDRAPVPYKLVTLTHVDTSTGVLTDVEAFAKIIREKSPSTLIAVDGVCSVGAEVLKQEEWGIDVVLTASQKALGVPPGLGVLVASRRAIDVALHRKAPPSTYFASFKKWLPIMQKYEARQPSYFATPPVQLIMSLHISLKQLLNAPGGMLARFEKHAEASNRIKDLVESWGLKLVAHNRQIAANTLTAVYLPEGVTVPALLSKMGSHNVVIAGGLHPEHAQKYFRIGHMNISVVDDGKLGHLKSTLEALKQSFKECGYTLPQ